MKYRSVGKSGLKISEVALGSWVTDLKGTAAEDVAKETVKLAYDSGVNFFDCADAYSGGAAERFLGKTLKQYPRKELVISSKVYFPTGEGVNDRGLSRKHIFESIDQTLKNMQTDYLDMYFCHRFDETTDLTETLRAMSDLVAQGKVLYYGVSEEWGSARLEEAQRIIDRANTDRQDVIDAIRKLQDDREDAREEYADLLKDIISDASRKLADIGANVPAAATALDGEYDVVPGLTGNFEIDEYVAPSAYVTPQAPAAVVAAATPVASPYEKDLSGFGDADDFEFEEID